MLKYKPIRGTTIWMQDTELTETVKTSCTHVWLAKMAIVKSILSGIPVGLF